jgi:peptidoglycan/xylan/chitin deacetylase (PgdA/CDA1 family)
METNLGRWLLILLVLLIAAGLVLLVPTLMRLIEPEPPAQIIVPTVPTLTPTPTVTPTPTLTPTPFPTSTPRPSPTPLPVLVGYTVHTVSAGETIAALAQRYGSLVPAIASLNRFSADTPLSAGQPLVIPLYAGPPISPTLEVHGVEVDRGQPGRRVALTFDAGASAEPAAFILDTLKQYDVHVTFFLTGKWAEDNPGLVRRIAAEGHEIGNHTYSHPHLPELDEAAIVAEIQRTEQIIRDLAGQTTRPLLRPPYGDRNQAVLDTLARQGYISVFWTVDSLDSVGEPKTADFILQRVTHPDVPLEGAIVLMHVGNRTTADALPAILEWLRQEGYQVVKVSEILRSP